MMRKEERYKHKPNYNYKLGPKDAVVIKSMFKEAGVHNYDPTSVHQLLQYVYDSATTLIRDAKYFSSIAQRKQINATDIQLAIAMTGFQDTYIPLQETHELAIKINQKPLSKIKCYDGLLLPPDKYCVISPNYKTISEEPQSYTIFTKNNELYCRSTTQLVETKLPIETKKKPDIFRQDFSKQSSKGIMYKEIKTMQFPKNIVT